MLVPPIYHVLQMTYSNRKYLNSKLYYCQYLKEHDLVMQTCKGCSITISEALGNAHHLSHRDFFLVKNPHLYLEIGSKEICSWERPRLWVPTASPNSSNSYKWNVTSLKSSPNIKIWLTQFLSQDTCKVKKGRILSLLPNILTTHDEMVRFINIWISLL